MSSNWLGEEQLSPELQMSADEALTHVTGELNIATPGKTSQQISEEILHTAKKSF